MAENQEQKSRKEGVMSRLRTRHPDSEYADDEALFGQIDDDYADYDRRLGEYEEREGKMAKLLGKDPRAAQFISDLAKGEDPWIAVLKRLGAEGVTDLMNDPSKQEAYAEANKEYVARVAREKDLEKEYETNFAESMNLLQQIQTEQGLSDEVVDAAMDIVMRMVNDAVVGKFSRETIDMALKMVSRDADIENARSEGEVAGRNAKIEAQLRKSQQGDGMPGAGAGSVNSKTTQRRTGKATIFDIARGDE